MTPDDFDAAPTDDLVAAFDAAPEDGPAAAKPAPGAAFSTSPKKPTAMKGFTKPVGVGETVSGELPPEPSTEEPAALKAMGDESGIGAVGKGLIAGTTYDFDDEALGAADTMSPGEAALLPLGAPGLAFQASRHPEEYVSSRDHYRAAKEAAKAKHPYLYGTSKLAASLISPVGVAGKSASVLGRVGNAALNGTLIGALSSAGASGDDKKNGTTWAQDAANTALGGGVGGIVGGAVGLAAPPVAKWLGSKADNLALRVAGLRGGISNKLQGMGYRTTDDAAELGNKLRTKKGLLPIWGGEADVATRAELLRIKSGKARGEALDLGDASKTRINPDLVANAADSRARYGLNETEKDAAAKARAFADSLRRTADRSRSLGSAEGPASAIQGPLAKGVTKRQFEPGELMPLEGPRGAPATYREMGNQQSAGWDTANFDTEAKLAPKLHRRAIGAAGGEIERQLGNATGAGNASKYRTANEDYGLAMDALKLSRDAALRDQGKHFLTAGDLITAGATGLGSLPYGGGPLGLGVGLGTLIATKAAKARGPALGTALLGAGERALQNEQAPQLSSKAVSDLEPYLRAMRGENDEEQR